MGETLRLVPATERLDLLAVPVAEALRAWKSSVQVERIDVAEIDPEYADTAALVARYEGVGLAESGNCVVVTAKRAGITRLAACVVQASSRADVNGLVRRHVDARKASFAPVELAVAETGMEYGGITPIGLPEGWPILVDADVAALPRVVIGSGLRRSKLFVPGEVLGGLPGAEVLDGLGIPSSPRFEQSTGGA